MTIPQCCRRSSIARQPSGGILSGIFPLVSLPLAVALPAKCALSECLKLGVQSRKRRATAAGCDDRGKHSTINELSARFPGSSTVEHSAVNRRVASSNLARGANLIFNPSISYATFFNFDFWCFGSPSSPIELSSAGNSNPSPTLSASCLRHSTSSFNCSA